ncbi:MAG TPA: o-succinylbenzoate synthase [Cytophagales bacterium]|nr:o-succinylbenzoate synthase [Cytophagales bacterium]
MALQASFVKNTFHFNFRAKTSRGVMAVRDSWFIKIEDANHPENFGVGEAGPLLGLSLELDDSFEGKLTHYIQLFNDSQLTLSQLKGYELSQVASEVTERIPDVLLAPSVLFAFETALLDLIHGGKRIIFKNKFIEGQPLPINGLIWMSGMDMMLQQIEIKIQDGFNCIKMKVGGINFEKECDILQYIRRKYFKMDITLRLDANGAFKEEEAMYKLEELAKYNIHSIEQPLKAGSDQLAALCKQSPIPIALDEELIGVVGESNKSALLNRIKPQFIVLKPSLHGGLSGCQQWITIAQSLNIGWWMTSALESSVGLNAIAQFTAEHDNLIPQGLGTGKIYENNVDSPLHVKNGQLGYDKTLNWVLPEFN